jgi:endonuclease YncB( thermonuclease family)
LAGEGRDKYGRLLVAMYVDGADVGETLIAEGLAVSYRGGQRINWCAKLGAA